MDSLEARRQAQAAVDELQPPTQRYVRTGLSVLSKFRPSVREDVVKAALSSMAEGGFAYPQDKIKKVSGVGDTEAAEIAAAVSILAGFLADNPSDFEAIFEASAGKLYETADSEIAKEILRHLFDQRDIIR